MSSIFPVVAVNPSGSEMKKKNNIMAADGCTKYHGANMGPISGRLGPH